MSDWRKVVWQSFRNHDIRSQWKAIAANVISVNLGVKEAYLFDQGRTDAETILNFLAIAQEAHLVSQLDVLDVGDLFVIHAKRLAQLCHSDIEKRFSRIAFVDVSPYLEQPRLITGSKRGVLTDQLCVFIDSLLNALSCSSTGAHDQRATTKLIALQSQSLMPLCVIFGYLVGYPVVYWINEIDPHSTNCLGMVSLYKYSVAMSTAELQHQTVSAFTVPEILNESVKNEIDRWKHHICNKDTDHHTLTLTEVTFTLPLVAL
jgi:hypothetical protein